MGGQPKSEASSLSFAEGRRLSEEPTEAIPQNQREAVGILSIQGEEDVNWLILTVLVLCSRGMRAQTFLVWAPIIIIIILQDAAAKARPSGRAAFRSILLSGCTSDLLPTECRALRDWPGATIHRVSVIQCRRIAV